MKLKGWYDAEEGWENELVLKNKSEASGKLEIFFMANDEEVLFSKILEVGGGETVNLKLNDPKLGGRQGPLVVTSEIDLSGHIRYHNKKTSISFNRLLEHVR